MKWSWKVGQLAGIDLRIHATFVLLLGWVLARYWMAGKSMEAMLAGVGFIFALFACVALHEMGHAVAARKFGIQTTDITLLPIGGVARLERMPEEPKQKLLVALAGPAVNVVISAILYCWLTLTNGWAPFGQLSVAAGPFVERLLLANISLVLFNLIPAFPMDGGHVLRALLAPGMTYSKATRLAVSVGQGLAFVFGFIGLFTNPMLLFIGLFVWIGASQETGAAQMRSTLSGTPARAAMLTDFEKLQSGDTLAEAVRLTLRGSQHDFPVIEQGRVTGILTRADLFVALAEYGQDHPVTAVMRREFLITESTEMLENVFQRLQECDCHTMPVVHDGRLVGLVTMDNLGEYLLTEAAMQKPRTRCGLLNRMFWRGEKQPGLTGSGIRQPRGSDHVFSGGIRPSSKPVVAGDRITQI
ncbi:MAG TPA: site-2 protease family protein [Candidatus Sulfotelmatobacter sp.]|nr:site-2 protease family protein [Candidatus Sulfotelmatobacter sp.]